MYERKKFPSYIIVFLAPAVIIYSIFMVYPLINSLRMSFFTVNADHQEVFAGLGNYIKLFTNSNFAPRFWGALKNNFAFFAIHMLVQNSIALVLAALISNDKRRGATFYRTVYFMPTVLSVVIIGFIWNLILNPLWGVSKTILGIFQLGFLFKPWLGLASTALPTVALISVWQFIGIPMILFYAALIAIPDELLEAATVDGATGWEVFWGIKFPLILPSVGIVSILTFVGNFNAFDLIYTMKGANAGPDFATDLMGTFFYRTFFGQQLQLGDASMGSTVAAMMFLIILTGVLLYTFVWQRRVQSIEM
jgi:raffinose/stachyose/melibiose transport system permease protein